jgi:pSer/pThr/pTyr-binding forkhead associated (FHA) protein
MVQLSVLSGKQAGSQWVARRFPVRIGRSAKADLRLDDPGVWDQHVQIRLKPKEGFYLQAEDDALVSVNGQPLRSGLLRSGDSIEIGATKLRFWLAESRQRGLASREWLTWVGIALISLGQVALVYWLLTL